MRDGGSIVRRTAGSMTCDEIGPEARALFAELRVWGAFIRIARFHDDEVVAMALQYRSKATNEETRAMYERLLAGFVDRYGEPDNFTAESSTLISYWVSGERTTTVALDAYDDDDHRADIEVYWH